MTPQDRHFAPHVPGLTRDLDSNGSRPRIKSGAGKLMYSQQRAAPDRVGAKPPPGGGRGLPGDAGCLLALVSFILFPNLTSAASHAANYAQIPDTLHVHVFSLKEDPQVISYNPEFVSEAALTAFVADLCDNQNANVQQVRPWFIQRLRGRKRAHVFCMGVTQ